MDRNGEGRSIVFSGPRLPNPRSTLPFYTPRGYGAIRKQRGNLVNSFRSRADAKFPGLIQAGDGRLLVPRRRRRVADLTNLEALAVPDHGKGLRLRTTTKPLSAGPGMPRLLVVLAAVAALLPAAAAHEHHGEAPTCSSGGGRVLAEFRPGEVTVDGHSDDWDRVEASEFALLPALDPDEDKAYSGGKVAVKVRLFQALFFNISSPLAHGETLWISRSLVERSWI